MSLTRPNPFLSKWAETGKRFDVPDSGADHPNGRADIQTGFPQETMKSVLQGGVPPWGQDHNQILYLLSQANQWAQAGGMPIFDRAFSDKNGGYAKGAIIQGSDLSKPWVFWVNLVDHNEIDPNGLEINKPEEQNGWIRFPILSSILGNMLQYDSDGKLFVPSPAVVTTVYVDSDKGDDLKNNGSIEYPYRSIYQAISSTTDYTSVFILLQPYVNNPYYYAYNFHEGHGHVKLNGNGDPVWAYPGQDSYEQSIWIDEKEANKLNNVMSLSVGARKVTITTHDDTFYLTAAALYGSIGSPIDPSAFKGVTRPKIVGFWRENLGAVKYLSFAGGDNTSQIAFNRLEIALHDVDKLTNAPPSLVGLFWSGVNYSFSSVVFHTLPQGAYHYLADGGGGNDSNYRIGACRFESFDSNGNFVGKFLQGGGATKITVFDDLTQAEKDGGTAGFTYIGDDGNEYPYEYIDMNQQAFLTRVEAYEGVEIINNPSRSYRGLITNFEIKGVK